MTSGNLEAGKQLDEDRPPKPRAGAEGAVRGLCGQKRLQGLRLEEGRGADTHRLKEEDGGLDYATHLAMWQ